MVTVDQQVVEAIRSARLRLREITLPVVYGTQGERKHCPMREGKAVTLTARVPYAEYRARAERSPTRAQGVLDLIDVCLVPRKSVEVTPTSVQRDGDVWRVRFLKGDQGIDDEDLFLGRARDYRTGWDELGAGAVILPFGKELARARAKAREKRIVPELAGVRRLAGELQTCRQVMTNMKAATLLKRAQRNLEAAERALLTETVIDSDAVAASAGSAGEADRPPSASSSACPSSGA